MKRAFIITAVLGAIVATFMLFNPGGNDEGRVFTNLPWQIGVLSDGQSRVFGVTLGSSTLGDARSVLGPDAETAIIVSSDAINRLEMFYRRFTAGPFSGKLVIAAHLPEKTLRGFIERSIKAKYMDSGARKLTLDPDDLQSAYQAPIASLVFIPVVSLDEQTARQRFGQPAETIRIDKQLHLLYPDKGLDLILSGKGRDIFQYVAPRNFEQLRTPLQEQSAAPAEAL